MPVGYSLLDPSTLIATEDVDALRVEELKYKILSDGRWSMPVMVEKEALFVMDGHHRLSVALELGLRFIPVLLLDYESVHVSAWRPGETITSADIFDSVRKGERFPIKTTRHIFKGILPIFDVPLGSLSLSADLPVQAEQSQIEKIHFSG